MFNEIYKLWIIYITCLILIWHICRVTSCNITCYRAALLYYVKRLVHNIKCMLYNTSQRTHGLSPTLTGRLPVLPSRYCLAQWSETRTVHWGWLLGLLCHGPPPWIIPVNFPDRQCHGRPGGLSHGRHCDSEANCDHDDCSEAQSRLIACSVRYCDGSDDSPDPSPSPRRDGHRAWSESLGMTPLRRTLQPSPGPFRR